jgi:hypothetical protein
LPPSFRPAYSTREAAWGVLDGILLTFWGGLVDVPLAGRYVKDLARLQRALPPGTIGGAITVVASGAPLPSSEVRALLANASTTGNLSVNVGSAVVITGEGFRASAVRAAVTGIAMLSRTRDLRAFATFGEAIADISGRVRAAGGTAPPPDALVEAMRVLRDACERA